MTVENPRRGIRTGYTGNETFVRFRAENLSSRSRPKILGHLTLITGSGSCDRDSVQIRAPWSPRMPDRFRA